MVQEEVRCTPRRSARGSFGSSTATGWASGRRAAGCSCSRAATARIVGCAWRRRRALHDRDAWQGRAHARGAPAGELARLGCRPAGEPGRARLDGRGQARQGPSGVGHPKSTRPRHFEQRREKYRTGEAARAAYPLMRLRDVTKTPSIPKSTHLDQRGAARQARPQDAAQGQGVRRSRGAAGPSAPRT